MPLNLGHSFKQYLLCFEWEFQGRKLRLTDYPLSHFLVDMNHVSHPDFPLLNGEAPSQLFLADSA